MATRFHWSVYWAAIAAACLLIASAGFVLGRITEPTPDPETETVMLDAPPACEEIAPALQTERARLATLADATDNAGALAAGLDDVALTKDGEQIIAAAEELDEANRRVQAARLALATDQAATDAVVADCTPERPE